MKKLFILSALALAISCSAPSQPASTTAGSASAPSASTATAAEKGSKSPGFSVKGQIKGKSGGNLYLMDAADQDHPSRSIPIDANGHFEFKDTVKKSSPGEFMLMDPSGMTMFKGGAGMGIRLTFFAQNGDDITISGDQKTFDLSDVSGNVYNDQLMELINAIKDPVTKEKAIWDQVHTIVMQRDPANNPKIEALGNSTDPYEKQITDTKRDFVSRHPDYLASGLALSQISGKIPIGDMEKLYASLTAKVKASPDADVVAGNIGLGRAEENAEAGKVAEDFVKKDRDGHLIKLSDYKGKYVLLDFWGSWCGACRASHPHLKELYAQYKDKGLVILGISEERTSNRAAWLKAIKQDALPWAQIMNDEGKSQSDVVTLYGVKAFPTKVLIGPDGKIILRSVGTNVTGGAMAHDGGGSAAGGTGTAGGSTPSTTTGAASSSDDQRSKIPLTELDIKLHEIFKS
jgi:thiol-disulfide isomerase/thioredoxin